MLQSQHQIRKNDTALHSMNTEKHKHTDYRIIDEQLRSIAPTLLIEGVSGVRVSVHIKRHRHIEFIVSSTIIGVKVSVSGFHHIN